MFEIYQRYSQTNTGQNNRSGSAALSSHSQNIQQKSQAQASQPSRQTPQIQSPQLQKEKAVISPRPHPSSKPAQGQDNQGNDSCKNNVSHQKKAASFTDTLRGFIPPTLYNQKTKKVFGVFKAEDILLAALVLLFLEKEDEDNTLLALALLYILVSEYIDLPQISL